MLKTSPKFKILSLTLLRNYRIFTITCQHLVIDVDIPEQTHRTL